MTQALLDQTEKKLLPIQARVRRAKRPLRGKDKIALAVGAVLNRYKVAKHFDITISDDDFSRTRNIEQINAEAALDGVYVVRTSVNGEALDANSTVKAYKQLSNAERAFRSLNSIDIEVRPIHHRNPDRVRATCFFACSPIMSNGICARRSSPSCLMITISSAPTPPAHRSSPRQSIPRPQI